MESTESPNIALVRRLYDAFSRRDLDDMLEVTASDMQFFPAVTAARVQRTEPYVGREGMEHYFADVARVWRDLEIIPQDFRDLGDRVLVVGRVYARGEGGYISDSPAGWLWRIESGKITWGKVFTSRAEAFAAAGLDV